MTTPGISLARTIAQWQELVDEFAPTVHLTWVTVAGVDWHDAYQPSSVDWFLPYCTLKDRNDSSVNVPNPGSAAFQQYNSKSAYLDPSSRSYGGNLAGAKFYVHIATVPNSETLVDFQYWFFYPYNGADPTTVAPIPVFGAHEGDWEHVVIRLDPNRQAIAKVFFAAHASDEGRWAIKPTTQIPSDSDHYMVTGKTVQVFSAWHSHASYSYPGFHFRTKTYFASNDVALGGKIWNSAGNEVIAIAPALLPGGASFTEPAWLLWKGKWGTTRESWRHWFGNSPDGPAHGEAWYPDNGDADWTGWNQAGPNVTVTRIEACIGPAGNLYVVGTSEVAGEHGAVCSYQSSLTGQWSAWAPIISSGLLPPDLSFRFSLVQRPTGDLAAYLPTLGGAVETAVLAPSSTGPNWTRQTVTFSEPLQTFKVIAGRDGRMHLFGLHEYGKDALRDLFYAYQDDVKNPMSWSPLKLIAENVATQVHVAERVDGTLAVVIAAEYDTRLCLRDLSNPDAPFDFKPISDVPTSLPSLSTSLAVAGDGRLVLFGQEEGEPVYTAQQTPDDPWSWKSGFTRMGTLTGVRSMSAGVDAQGVLFAIAHNEDGIFFANETDWSNWHPLGTGTSHSNLAILEDGRLRAFAVRANSVNYRSQIRPPSSRATRER